MLSLFRVIKSLIVAIFLVFLLVNQAFSEPRIGLWVESEGNYQPYTNQKGFNHLKDLAREEIFTDLYCQVYRNGRSWFPSMLADDSPYREALKAGLDPLKDSIELAKSRGQKVHAWFNVMRIISNRRAPLFKVLGKDVTLHDNHNQSFFDYSLKGKAPRIGSREYSVGTPGIWLEPSSKKLRHYLVEQIREVLIAYPELDGIHLDMIRQPIAAKQSNCLLYTSPSPRDATLSRMPSSA